MWYNSVCIKLFLLKMTEGVGSMGKNLKGKELGVGISQRKDGLYTARFTDKSGKRRQKYFKKLQECRNWLADVEFQDEHGGIDAFGDMTVDAWFGYWMENFKKGNVKNSTLKNYNDRFKHDIKPYIGNMLLSEVKPMHCQNVLNKMSGLGYCSSTIGLTKVTMYNLFDSAVENGMVNKNPVSKTVKCINAKKPKPERVLTRDEQRTFLEFVSGRSHSNQYALVLQTGLRAGELAGLKWQDIDFGRGVLHVARTVDYRTNSGEWDIRSPKSKAGMRDIPLTKDAIQILRQQQLKMRALDVIPLQYRDFVFLSKNGNLIKNSTYNKDLARICNASGIRHFSMHTLRHTFATRCAESGMQPKTLQSILGHGDINVTMNIYVHCTEEQKAQEIRNIESGLCVV